VFPCSRGSILGVSLVTVIKESGVNWKGRVDFLEFCMNGESE